MTDKSTRDASLNVHASASQQGKAERASGSTSSQATSQRDVRDNNKRAKEEHPEAPEPVIGMNEERGRKGY